MNSPGRFSLSGHHYLPLFAVLVPLVLLFPGCESSTTPENQDPPDEESYSLIDSWTVGAGGGSLTGEFFLIDIPAGALTVDTDVNLYSSKTEAPFGENSNTDMFKLEGITEFSEPIRVALQYSGPLPESPFVAHGAEQTNFYDQGTATEYDLIAAADSSGYLVVYLPPNSSGLNREDKDRTEISNLQFLLGLMTYRELNTGEYFKIQYPESVADPEGIEDFLEELRLIIVEDLGFDFRHSLEHNNLDWPIKVLVRPLSGENQNSPTIVRRGNGRDCTLTINKTFLENGSIQLPVSAGKGLLHVALFVEAGWVSSLFSANESEWFNYAILDWSEDVFTVDDSFVHPADFAGHEFTLFSGLKTWSAEGPYWDYVRSTAAFVKYLTEVYDLAAPARIIEATVPFEPVYDGIETASGTDFGQIWREFCVEHLKGSIYGVDPQLIVQQGMSQNPPWNWKIQGAEDLAHDFNGSAAMQEYGGFEAKVFSIDFKYRDFGNSSKLRLSTAHQSEHDDILMQVFGVTNEGLVQLGDDQSVLDLRLQSQLFDQGIDQVIVLLVNEEYDRDNFNTTFTRDFLRCQIVQELDFPSMYVRIFVDAEMYNKEDGSTETWELFGYYNKWLNGNFDGDQFEYTEYESGGNWWKRTTATGQIDLATGDLLDFVIETNSESYKAGILVAWEHKKFDLISGLSPGFEYETPMIAVGYGVVCQYIENFEYESQSHSYVSHSCDPESYIRLEWHSE